VPEIIPSFEDINILQFFEYKPKEGTESPVQPNMAVMRKNDLCFALHGRMAQDILAGLFHCSPFPIYHNVFPPCSFSPTMIMKASTEPSHARRQ